ncbi:ankyrin repeat protein [Actinophytocola oryzae]|uniref:Ankyrin repeat protein n=1 Tax=Actinophytocola oryzae TaxID=502181 RepID=A0A4R7V9E8_9PSEU|nr:ankyrin repeat protein [Actinophytocola oryzae]
MTRRDTYKEHVLANRDALADAARDGRWDEVFARLDEDPSLVNAWRPGGTSWYTPVHQAAWHGVDLPTVRRLLTYGPWLTLRDARGDRPLDIALRGGRAHLDGPLVPVVRNPVSTDTLTALRRHLHGLVRERAAELVDEQELRLPEPVVLTELGDPGLWFAVPGMYGGFHIVLRGEELAVESWSRVVGGSGQRHLITRDGCVLTEQGFV